MEYERPVIEERAEVGGPVIEGAGVGSRRPPIGANPIWRSEAADDGTFPPAE